jgi:hypothetical protein
MTIIHKSPIDWILEDLLFPITFFIFKVIIFPFKLIGKGILRILTDVFAGVYGKFIGFIVTLVILIVCGFLTHFFKK